MDIEYNLFAIFLVSFAGIVVLFIITRPRQKSSVFPKTNTQHRSVPRIPGDDKDKAFKAIIVEYEDLRDEIKRRIDQRTHITELMITIDGTLAGATIYTGNWFILGIVPFVSAFCLTNIKASYVIHQRLTAYISNVIEEQKLPMVFSDSDRLWLSWETFYRKRLGYPQRQEGTRRNMYNMFELTVFTGCSTALVVSSFVQFEALIAFLVSAAYLVLGFFAVIASRIVDPYKADPCVNYDWQSLNAQD